MTEHITQCHPLTLTRSIEDFPIGNLTLAEHQCRFIGNGDAKVHPHAWIDDLDWEAFIASGKSTMVSATGEVVSWHGEDPDLDEIFSASDSFIIRHPWDLLRANELHVGRMQESFVFGEVHSSAVIEGIVHVGEGTRILPGVFIEGNVFIGANCKIGPNCYLRGNTSIGDQCHIGQSVEIKNSIILSHTNVGHLSYVGDSILGERVNLGAGTIVSNFRHDGATHRSMVDGILVDTGRRKFGAIIGDDVHTGIQTSIYPGRKMWPGTSTRPGEIVERDLMG